MARKKLNSMQIGNFEIDVNTIILELYKIRELSLLGLEQMNELALDLVNAAGFAAAGYPVDRSDKSGLPKVRKFFLSDIARAMTKQGLKVSSSRLYSGRNRSLDEATIYKIARLLAPYVSVQVKSGTTVPLEIPKDPLRLLNEAKRVIYNH